MYSLVTLAAVFLMAAMIGGCGSIGSGDAPGATNASISLSGSVLTPAGAAAWRESARGAAALSNVTVPVNVSVYAANSAGRTLIASGQSGADGNFSIPLPAGVNPNDYHVVISAAVGTGAVRALATGNTGISVSPISEATLQIIEDQLAASGKTIDVLSLQKVKDINTKVAAALAAVNFAGVSSTSDAIALAKNTAIFDSAVTAAVNDAVTNLSPTQYAVFTTTDYTTGALAVARLNGSPGLGVPVRKNVASINADASVTTDGRYIYVINRGGDNIQVLDPRNNFSLVSNYTTGTGSNPHDMEIISPSKAYITRYQKSSILIVNPTTGAQLGTIDLSQFNGPDGVPDMDQMISAGGKIFVTVQRLSNFSPSAPGLLVVIDPNTDTVVDTSPSTPGTQAITLNGYNPQYIEYLPATGKLYVSCSGNYFDATVPAGVDAVDANSYAVSTITTKATLNGSPGDLKIVSATKGYVVVSGANWVNSIMAFNPTSGALIGSGAVYTAGGYVPSIGLDPFGYLLISDNSYTNPGTVFLDVATDKIASGPLPVSTGLPPFAVTFVSVPAQ